MNIKNISIRQAKSDDKALWDDYIAVHKDGLAYNFYAWKESVEESYNFECPYFLAEKGGQIYGVLPTVYLHNPLSKGQLVSLPYCDAGGILAENSEIAEALFNYACNYSIKHRIPSLEIRYPSHIPELPIAGIRYNVINTSKTLVKQSPPPEKVRLLLELPNNAKTLMASFKSKLRSQINKPVRDGLTAKLGGLELLEDFYSIFAENMRDLGSPVHSKKWLRSVLTRYGKRAKCCVVSMPDKTPAASGILLCHDRVVSIPWASSLKRFNRFNPNMLLYWSFLEYATNSGHRFFDFGRSTFGEGTYKFKVQWGASPQPLYWERFAFKNSSYHMNNETRLHSTMRGRALAEKVIQKSPLPLAIHFGSRIRKYISL